MTKHASIKNANHDHQVGGRMGLPEWPEVDLWLGGRAGVPLYLPCTGCVFVGGTWASVVSLRPPTKNISRCCSSMPLHPLPQASRAHREVKVHSKMSKLA